MIKQKYIVCKDFNTAEIQFFHVDLGFNRREATMFSTNAEALLKCASQLDSSDVTIERFVSHPNGLKHVSKNDQGNL